MTKKQPSKESMPPKSQRGRPEKTDRSLMVETTVAMGCTFAERGALKSEALQRGVSLSNLLRLKTGHLPIVARNASES